MSFRDRPTTTATSEIEPSQILLDGLQLFALTDKGVTGGFFSGVAGVLDRHPNFIIYLIVWLLYYIIFWLHLRSVDDSRVYIFIYKYVQTGVIYWVEEGPKCIVMLTIIFFYYFYFYFHGWIDLLMEQGLKCNVMPTIIFFLFLRLNGSVNGLKPRIYYYYYLKIYFWVVTFSWFLYLSFYLWKELDLHEHITISLERVFE